MTTTQIPADTDCTCGRHDRDGAPLGCFHDDEDRDDRPVAEAPAGPLALSYDDEPF